MCSDLGTGGLCSSVLVPDASLTCSPLSFSTRVLVAPFEHLTVEVAVDKALDEVSPDFGLAPRALSWLDAAKGMLEVVVPQQDFGAWMREVNEGGPFVAEDFLEELLFDREASLRRSFP